MRPSIRLIFSVSYLSIFCNYAQSDDLSCGDWEPYQQEKCYKILDELGLKTYAEAEKTCQKQENGATLVTISSHSEQEFLTSLLKSPQMANDAWIGVKYVNNRYKLSDESELTFTNWETGSPKNQTDHCVQINSAENSFGKWSDVLCTKFNLVLCQRLPSLTLSQVTKLVLNSIKNPLPIGFIYVQLPNEKSPTEIWPWMSWTDISAAYAGVFFRVTGGSAAPFESLQQQNVPYNYIDEVRNLETNENSPSNLNVSGWSSYIRSGKSEGGTQVGLRFHVIKNEGEVRPINMAIRVWKRTG